MITQHLRKRLQTLQSDARWAAVEEFLKIYMTQHFVQGSVKRANEFDTIWYLAEQEGGKSHLQRFFNQLEEEAKKAND